MKLPVAIGGAIATAFTAAIALTGELDLSHPLHQAIVIAGGLAIAIVGYLTISPTAAAPAGPPYTIPDPLPVPTPAAAASSRAAIDQAAEAAAASRSLP
jgi:hypothetical protein